MSDQSSEQTVRPGVAVAMLCILAAGLTGLWLLKFKPVVSAPVAETLATEQPAVSRAAAPVFKLTAAAAPSRPLEEKWGIRISSVRLTNDNAGLEVRYLVTDPEKAAMLSGEQHSAMVVDQTTGAQIPLTRPPGPPGVLSHSRARSIALSMPRAIGFPPPAGRLSDGGVYSVWLPNTGGVVKPGSKVTVAIGDSREEDLVIE